MNRDQAFVILGLYLGATRDHIQDKYRRKRDELLAQPESSARAAALKQLDEAVRVAQQDHSGVPDSATLAPGTTAPSQPQRKLFKGWILLLLVLAALGVYTIVTFAVGGELDSRLAGRDTDQRINASREIRDAWEKYRLEAGQPPAIEADQAFARARAAKADEARAEYERAEALYAQAFADESRRLLARLDAEFVQPWRTQVQPHFPFNAEAETDAPAELVRRLLAPGTGAFWELDASLRRLAGMEVGGRVLAPLPVEYMRTFDAMFLLRNMLFHDGKLQTQFAVRLTSNNRFRALVLEVGDQLVRSGGETYTPVNWQVGKARIRVTLGQESAREPALRIDESDSEWGLLRVLWRFELVQSHEGLLVWEFDQDATARPTPGRKPRKPPDPLVVHILADKQGHPFDPAALGALHP